jgi:hypothetical protein
LTVPSISLSSLLDIITVVILGTGAVLGLRQLAGLREEQRLKVFMAYSQRYSDVMRNLPDEVRDPLKSIFEGGPSKEELAAAKNSMRQLFDIFSDEFYLNEKGLIEKSVWEWWVGGMHYHMGQESYRDAWNKIFREGYAKNFVELIDSFAKNPATGSPA